MYPDSPTQWPSPSDVPTWGQSGTPTGGQCDWSGSVTVLSNVFTVAIASGSSSFTASVFDLLHIGPAYRISVDGATMQAYSVSVTSWSTSTGASSSKNFVDFDVPQNPLPSVYSSITLVRTDGCKVILK
jgi:hypothetical protein